MKIPKVGIAIGALLVALYAGYSAIIFFNKDSGNSNERWVGKPVIPPSTAAPAAPAAPAQPKADPEGLGSGGDLEAVYSVVMKNLEAGEFDKVVAATTSAIEKNPKVAALHYFRGFANLQKKQIDDAIRDFSAALETAPAHADALRFRSQAYMTKGQIDLAIADADKACGLEPQNPESYVARAMAYMTKGDNAKAKLDVAKALQLNPNNAKAKVLSQKVQESAKAPK